MKENTKNSFYKKISKNLITGAITTCLVTSMLVCSPASNVYAKDKLDIFINGTILKTDRTPFIQNDRTYIPVRAVTEALGANVTWDNTNRTVTVTKGNSKIKLYVDNRLYSYVENGVTKYGVSDVAPMIKNDSTFIPIRLVANALGLDVTWDNANRDVLVSDKTVSSLSKFFNITVNGVKDGQTITGPTSVSLSGVNTLPSTATQIKYFLLNPTTGEGKIVARSTNISQATTFIPSVSNNGNNVLAAIVCDKNGNFLAGDCVSLNVKVNPTVSLAGITEGQNITSAVSLSANLNFRPYAIKYEFTYNDGSKVTTDELDPYGTYTFSPSYTKGGAVSVRVIAIDENDKSYYSSYVKATVSTSAPTTTPYVTLKNFTTANVGKVPVTLSIARNFDADTTEYYAQNTSTGETVLLYKTPWGDYSWFPSTSMAGNWKVYVKVINSKDKKAYYSNSINVTVPNTPSLVLSGIGPDQVITGTMTMSSVSNQNIKSVSYIISNPYNYTQVTMGTATSTSTKISFTPTKVNQGKRYIQAIATTTDGKVIKSEKITVNIYLGTLYSAKPLTAKTNFINYVTPLALKTQKENGMSAALQIAQAVLETGWGQSVPVDKYTGLFSNNLFGIKGTGNNGSVTCSTTEEYYGTLYKVDANFRAYKTPYDSWSDHNALLVNNSRYLPYVNVMFDSTAGAYALKRCGYATDSGYPGKLIYLIERYNLDELDKQKI